MAEFRGYKCDRCAAIVEKQDLTRRTVRYVGSTVNGEYDEDLCPSCTEDAASQSPNLRPLRRRQPGKTPALT